MRTPARFVDAHVHFFDRDAAPPGLRWSWLEETSGVGHVPDTAPIAGRRFTPAELFAEGHRLGRLSDSIHIQAATGTDDGLVETRWLAQLREQHGAPRAAVAFVDVTSPRATAQVESQREYTWVRGIRDTAAARTLTSTSTQALVRRLAKDGLVFEVLATARRLADVRALAGTCPDTVIVLDHLALPPLPGSSGFAYWCQEIASTAACANVWIKLSGFGLISTSWTDDVMRELVNVALDTFGPYRCMVGSNWPLDKAASSYPDVVDAVARAATGLNDEEFAALFAGSAEHAYRLI